MRRGIALSILFCLCSSSDAADWPMLYGSPHRNNVSSATRLPDNFDVAKGTNIKWKAKLGSQSYGSLISTDGKIYVGTNNGAGYLRRFPAVIDLGCLLCFRESDGEFLWQYSAKKLATGRVHDWPLQGICSSPYVEGNRMWFVSNRGEVVCLDTEGFRDGVNDGPFHFEDNNNLDEADIVWNYDLMGRLGVSQHNMASCSPLVYGNLLFVSTSNGIDNSHLVLPAPNAPSFIAMNKNTGEVLWTDNSPGENILHGQWSSPALGEFNGVPQVIFPGGDGWIYSFHASEWNDGKPILLWKFDGNPKESKWQLGGVGTRNNALALPVIHDSRVYIVMGQDPHHGYGTGNLWCIDPTKRGDISSELAINKDGEPLPPRRLQAINTKAGERTIPNPNSGVVWSFEPHDLNQNGKIDPEEEMHRSIASPVIEDGLLYLGDIFGIFHCIDANTGVQFWNYDALSAYWATPLIADGKVFAGDEDGDLVIFRHSKTKRLLNRIAVDDAIKMTPVALGNTLYIGTLTSLYAIFANEDPLPE